VNGVSKALFETPCTSLGLLLVLYWCSTCSISLVNVFSPCSCSMNLRKWCMLYVVVVQVMFRSYYPWSWSSKVRKEIAVRLLESGMFCIKRFCSIRGAEGR
jgi:hypothetical protein